MNGVRATERRVGGVYLVVRSTLAVMSGGADPRPPDPFEAFYRRAWRDAVRWATALTGSVAAGEDLAQDAFARVRSRFPSIDNADGYLRATIVNLARDQRRATDRRAARELRVVGEPVLAPSLDEREPRLVDARSPAFPTSSGRRSCCGTGPTGTRRRSPPPSAVERRPCGRTPSAAWTRSGSRSKPTRRIRRSDDERQMSN